MRDATYDPSLYVDVRPCADGRVDPVLVFADGETHVVLSPDAARSVAWLLNQATGPSPTFGGTF